MLPSALCLALSLSAPSQVPAKARQGYQEILKTYVKDGLVDYKGIEKTHRAQLKAYVDALATAKVPVDKLEKIGFLADAYNALVLESVIDNHRPRSVLDVKGFFDAKKWKVASKSLTLNELEKQMINPLDPRTHMVLVCAAVGCPVLDSKPLYGSDVEARLDTATRRYLASPKGAKVDAGKLQLSKIFEWYAKDFGGADGVLRFVKAHLTPELAKKLGDSPTVSYFDYNWTLNQQ